ncbi:MAG: signal recognition particle receptor subunit alpha [Desulfosudis oleivorans]|nr:signal recognition particle receptor subunit alpha [Desulfosudis oleivorans]
MLEKLSGKLTDLVRQISGKAHISEKNIQDAIDEIKIALLEADVNLRVVRRFVNQATEEALGEKVLRSVVAGPAVRQARLRPDGARCWATSTQSLALKGPDTVRR